MLETLVFSLVVFASDAATIAYDAPNFSDVTVEKRYRRRPPRYPPSCSRGKKAGAKDFVTLMFDIESNGRPKNIRIIDTTDGCFSRVSRKAVGDWRYTKPIYRGASVKILDVTTRMTFTLGWETD